MPRPLRRLVVALILIVVVGAILYLRFFRPAPVFEHQVTRGSLLIEVMGTGTVEARVSTGISPKIQGRLTQLGADQGDHVAAGQVIARLDDSDLRRQTELAGANIEIARAGLARLESEVQRAQAVERNANRERQRIQSALNRGAATESERDDSTERVAIAEAELATALAGVAEGQKTLIAAQKNLEYQQARLDDTVLLAPFDGLIVRRDRDPGDVVVPGSSIYVLVSLTEIWVSAWVDETELDALAPGQPARVIFRSEPAHPYPGHVARIGRETDRETRELLVDIAIESLPERWAIGQRAEVMIETQRLEDVLTIPAAAILIRDGEPGVFLNRSGRARWTPCELGRRNAERVEVRSGLAEHDVAVWITDGAGRAALRNGRRVTAP